MRRLPPLAAIRAFEAAARTENFTAAAAELGMTQAAVSYQVKSLEERLGAPLFVREKGRIIGTNNFYNTVGLLIAAAALSGLHDKLHIQADTLILIFGIVTLASELDGGSS